MPSSAAGTFYHMLFSAPGSGQAALATLGEFAPRSIRTTLQAQLPRLRQILRERLGVDGLYEWHMVVESGAIHLFAVRTDGQPMSIAEGLKIELDATRRASRAAQDSVRIIPEYMCCERQTRDLIWSNVRAGRHWSDGLA